MEARKDGATNASAPLVVPLRLADGSLYKEKGKIDFIDVTVDPKTDGQIVRATFDNKQGQLTDGQTLRVVIEDEKPQNVVVAVPQQAIAIDQAGALPLRRQRQEPGRAAPGQDRRPARRPAGRQEGLKAGEKVIIQGQQRVRPGMTVNPTSRTATSATAEGLSHDHLLGLHPPPAAGLRRLDGHFHRRPDRHGGAAGRPVPRHRAAAGPRHRDLSRRLGPGGRGERGAGHRSRRSTASRA